MVGTCSQTLPWFLLRYVLVTVFTVKAQRITGRHPAIYWSLLLRRLHAAALERGRDFVDHSIIAFFSYESGNCVINSSVTFDQVLVSKALTGASLNVFNLKSEAKKSIDMNTSCLACILKPSAEHLLTNHSADICQWTLEPLLGCICPEKIKGIVLNWNICVVVAKFLFVGPNAG